MSALLLALFLQAAPRTRPKRRRPHPCAGGRSGSPAPEQQAPQPRLTRRRGATPAAEGHAPEAAGHGGAAEHGESPADIIFHHVLDGPTFFGVFKSKHLVFLLLVALLVILMAQLAVRSYKGGHVPKGLGAAVESLVVFIRDEVAEPNIGQATAQVHAAALQLLLLHPGGGALRPDPGLGHFDRNISVTLALATVSFRRSSGRGSRRTGSSATSTAWCRQACPGCCCRS
jgi:hypothetical protein